MIPSENRCPIQFPKIADKKMYTFMFNLQQYFPPILNLRVVFGQQCVPSPCPILFSRQTESTFVNVDRGGRDRPSMVSTHANTPTGVRG